MGKYKNSATNEFILSKKNRKADFKIKDIC